MRRSLQNLLVDIRFGGFLGHRKSPQYSELGAHWTGNTDYEVLAHLLDPVVARGDVFVDVGCGKGRVLNWVIAQGRAQRIYGIEIEPKVAAEVARRLAKYHQVTIVAGDAATNIPDEATVLYLYNPFNREVMARFRDAAIAQFNRLGKLDRVRIVYFNCVALDVFASDPRCLVEPLSVPKGIADDRLDAGALPAALIRFRSIGSEDDAEVCPGNSRSGFSVN